MTSLISVALPCNRRAPLPSAFRETGAHAASEMLNLWGRRSKDGISTPTGPLGSSPPGGREPKCSEVFCISAPPKVHINGWGQIQTRPVPRRVHGIRGQELFPESADGDRAARPVKHTDEINVHFTESLINLAASCPPPGSQACSSEQQALLSTLTNFADAQRESLLRLATQILTSPL